MNRRDLAVATGPQHPINSLKRVYYEENFIRQDYQDIAMTLVENLIRQSKEKSIPVNLSELESYDDYTYAHSINVALLATIIGLQMSYDREMLNNLALGALFHDWGKLQIPLEILNKPSGLTAGEFDMIRKHPDRGEHMLKPVILTEEALKIVRQHHERWNGQGYPDSLSGDQISHDAQIVAVADVFDALTADRPYREGLSPYHALEMILSGVNSNFSVDAVKAFRSCLILYPEDSRVILNTGEKGTVIAIPPDFPTRPVIRVLLDPKGQPVLKGKIVDLLQNLSLMVIGIEFSSLLTSEDMKMNGV